MYMITHSYSEHKLAYTKEDWYLYSSIFHLYKLRDESMGCKADMIMKEIGKKHTTYTFEAWAYDLWKWGNSSDVIITYRHPQTPALLLPM